MRYLYTIILLFSINSLLFSQQTPVFSEYHINPFLINSAYAGLTPKQITLTHNGNLGGFEGAPSTSALSFISDVGYSNIGYGFGVTNDQIGVTENTSIYGAFSYKLEFDHIENRADWEIYDMNVLSFGITAGLQMYRDNLQELGIDDDINFAQNINITIPTIGAGIMYNRANFFVGFSSPNLIGTALVKDDFIEITPQFYGYSGFRFYTNQFEDLLIKPSILVKYQEGAPLQTDFNISGVYKNRFELGLGYRTTSAFSALAGFYLNKNFRLLYNFNYYTNDFVLGSTHGIGASYRFMDKNRR
ncbi:MAG: hypothetical protein CR994_03645 [Maribacter sp.]|nr:MAG: hypothetical protein CR994_03645 [Maribacter sp.]